MPHDPREEESGGGPHPSPATPARETALPGPATRRIQQAEHPTEPMLPAAPPRMSTATMPSLREAAAEHEGTDRPFLLLTEQPDTLDPIRAAIRGTGAVLATRDHPLATTEAAGSRNPWAGTTVDEVRWFGQRFWLDFLRPQPGEAILDAAREYAARMRLLPIGGLGIVGIGGAIDPLLDRGHLVLASGCASPVRPHGPVRASPAIRRLLESARKSAAVPSHLGGILTIPEPAETPMKKTRLARRWREAGFLAYDRVSMPLVAAADRLGLPWFAVRAVLDAASDRLPLHIPHATPDGCRAPSLLATYLLRPWRLLERPNLVARQEAASAAVARFVEGFARSLGLPDEVDTDHLADVTD